MLIRFLQRHQKSELPTGGEFQRACAKTQAKPWTMDDGRYQIVKDFLMKFKLKML